MIVCAVNEGRRALLLPALLSLFAAFPFFIYILVFRRLCNAAFRFLRWCKRRLSGLSPREFFSRVDHASFVHALELHVRLCTESAALRLYSLCCVFSFVQLLSSVPWRTVPIGPGLSCVIDMRIVCACVWSCRSTSASRRLWRLLGTGRASPLHDSADEPMVYLLR